MAELADALDSGSSLRTGGGGSTPPSGTRKARSPTPPPPNRVSLKSLKAVRSSSMKSEKSQPSYSPNYCVSFKPANTDESAAQKILNPTFALYRQLIRICARKLIRAASAKTSFIA